MAEDVKVEKGDTKLFELGYLYSPLVPEADITQVVADKVGGLIVAAGGTIAGEIAPKMMALSYPVTKAVEHQHTIFTDAYFGAIRLNIAPEALLGLEAKLKLEPSLVRFTFLTLPKNAGQLVAPKRVTTRKPTAPKTTKEEVEVVAAPTAEPMTKEAIDKEIEGLLEQPA